MSAPVPDALLERLRVANPVPSEVLQDVAADPGARALLRAILAANAELPARSAPGVLAAGSGRPLTGAQEVVERLRRVDPVTRFAPELPAAARARLGLREAILSGLLDELVPSGGHADDAPGAPAPSPADRSWRRAPAGEAAAPCRRWRRPAVLVPAAAVLAAAAAAAGFGLAPVHPSAPYEVACYPADSLGGSAGVPPAGASPVARCAALWASGAFGQGAPVPPLVTCVLPDGAYAVLPGKDDRACTVVGLPAALSPTSTGGSLAALQQVITDQLNGSACATAAQAEQVLTHELAVLGLGSWSVVTAAAAPPGCATAAIDPGHSLVEVVRLPAAPQATAGASGSSGVSGAT